MDNDVITCPVPYGGMLLFNNLTPHRRFEQIQSLGNTCNNVDNNTLYRAITVQSSSFFISCRLH